MRQAKQQSQDLRQTDEFLTAIMKPGYLEKEKAKHSPSEMNSFRQANGRPKMPRVDSFSRFSEPPAPPPQQPLPEKPDAVPRNGVDLIHSLKRSDTEKPKPPTANSPSSRESSQILSLVEALSSAKREIDSQGARVKELETLLLQERSAREVAEQKARKLETQPGKQGQEFEVVAAFEPPSDAESEETVVQRNHEEAVEIADDSAPTAVIEGSTAASAFSDGQTTQLQRRLEAMVGEMEEMRQQVAVFKDRAHKAEDESAKTRKSLAEMIETLRRERTENSEAATGKPVHRVHDPSRTRETTSSCQEEHTTAKEFATAQPTRTAQARGAGTATATLAAEQHQQGLMAQSSPYASMIGVVLLGVGLMAYLNSWQKMDK